jgi:hypothetical protein
MRSKLRKVSMSDVTLKEYRMLRAWTGSTGEAVIASAIHLHFRLCGLDTLPIAGQTASGSVSPESSERGLAPPCPPALTTATPSGPVKSGPTGYPRRSGSGSVGISLNFDNLNTAPARRSHKMEKRE